MGAQRVIRTATFRASLLYRSPRFRVAYVKGALAARAGRPIDSCPYPRDPRKTWRQVYRLAWLKGYQSVIGRPPSSR